MEILISDNGDMSWDSIKSYLAQWNCEYKECSPNLKSKNNSQHIKPESTIEADSCRPCETQKDKIVDTSHNLNKESQDGSM